MLLDEVLCELYENGLQNAENEEPCGFNVGEINADPLSSIPEETTVFGESVDDENSGLLENTLNSIRSPEREIKLSLESDEKLSNNLQSQNSECLPGFYGATASIPFQWEEKPGKPKNPPIEKPNIALRLPPVRQSGLYFHVGDSKLTKERPGRLKNTVQRKPPEPITASKPSNERNPHRQEFSSEYANSDLESIWEEEEEEEMLELCRKTYPFREFQEMCSTKSYGSGFSETIDQCMGRILDFPNNSRGIPMKRGMVARSAEFGHRIAHSYNAWIGSRSAELGPQFSWPRSRSMVENPLSEGSLLPCNSSVSDCTRPSIPRSVSNWDPAPALLANCLIPVTEMSNAIPVEDSVFSSCRFIRKNILSKAVKKDHLENDGSWASLVQRNLSGQLRSTQKYHQKLVRARSLRSTSSLNPLKRVSSMVKRTVWDSPRSLSSGGMEFESLEKLRKTQMETSKYHVEDEEESTSEDEDDSVIDHVCSPEGSTCAFVDRGPESSTPSETSSNSCRDLPSIPPRDTNSFLNSVPLGLQGGNSYQALVHSGAYPKSENPSDSIPATSVRADCSNNVQKKFQDGLKDGALLDTEPGECMACCEKHSKRRNRTKIRSFCTPLKISVNSCCFQGGRHSNRSEIHSIDCIKQTHVSLSDDGQIQSQ